MRSISKFFQRNLGTYIIYIVWWHAHEVLGEKKMKEAAKVLFNDKMLFEIEQLPHKIDSIEFRHCQSVCAFTREISHQKIR